MKDFIAIAGFSFGLSGWALAINVRRQVKRMEQVIRTLHPGLDRDAFDPR